ncbi:MAG: PIN domain-containing protein [Chloroflexi bacterium]|nr:PIN domain-containing protein [Chloroflexota bacterium]
MAPLILLDTHVIIWLYEGDLARIPAAVQQRLRIEQLGLSPFVQLELGYLKEVGRIRPTPDEIVRDLSARLELVIADVTAAAVCNIALGLSWTRDPFDRLLAAHATLAGLPLITKDETLRRHLPLAWWSD